MLWLSMLKSNRSMSLMCILWLLIVCVAPGSRGQRDTDTDEQPAAEETHAICYEEGCFAVFFHKKFFREAGQACREQGGTLATIYTHEAASLIHKMLSAIEPQGSKTRFRFWIGLHRPPRQCSFNKPLRGFIWVTGNQDGQFTNWIREEMPKTCAAHRCVALSVTTPENGQESKANYRWAEGPCALHLDGYICQYKYKATCSPLGDEGSGPAVYTTPFQLTSTLLTHVPYGSVAVLPCSAESTIQGAFEEKSVLCTERDDGTVGWSSDAPLCSSSPATQYQDWCSGNHGCEQYCENQGNDYYCYCSEGFIVGEDGYTCEPDPLNQNDPPELSSNSAIPTNQPIIKRVCVQMGCEYSCFESARGIRCTCPPGYQIGPDGRRCSDVDECQQQPCPQLCVNIPGTFHCMCHQGYQPDNDGECMDIDECLDEGSCEGACENTIGSFTCLCAFGYVFSEGQCLDVNECLVASPCQQQCINYDGGFLCKCNYGFDLQPDGTTCQPLNNDGEYSTLTPDVDTSDEYDIPWATTDSYFETEFTLIWHTEAPDVLTPDMEHQTDDLSPRQYQTAQSPTQKYTTYSDIFHDAETEQREPSDGAVAKTINGSTSGSKESDASKMSSTKDTNSTAEAEAGSASDKRKHDKSWLLVALLVPLCVFLVVMLALGIVYCTSCAVDKSLSFLDCYRWVLPTTPSARKEGKTQA